MSTTAAERKAKQRKLMLEKGLFRKDFWIDQECIDLVQSIKVQHTFQNNDQALDYILKSFSLITKKP